MEGKKEKQEEENPFGWVVINGRTVHSAEDMDEQIKKQRAEKTEEQERRRRESDEDKATFSNNGGLSPEDLELTRRMMAHEE
jgi:hypothetical protein